MNARHRRENRRASFSFNRLALSLVLPLCAGLVLALSFAIGLGQRQ